ncbi:uncharacterized protein LOC110110584 [Dendrobium catenatum]|uniref:uncharacterized protein LOC110110584 n=1 Tax=Dendrobium catenatum TaxID=906689 RepID=UPI0009F1A9BF|nr:uncharacterized protein LOC110110584 [Dendrobium catenatum]
MYEKGFPQKFFAWIKGCIYDVTFSICINGALQGYFNSTSGLRQGCPLSPLLFAIAMDVFSCYLDGSNFCGFPCGNTSYTHLLYADDVLIFGPATVQNAQALNNILSYFGDCSSLHINREKCSIIFSKESQTTSDILNLLHFSQADHVIKYLGLPTSTKRLTISHFQPLLSKITILLAGWKVKFLSFVGRIKYLKFTIANTIAYWIRGAIIPKAGCKLIDRICARFLYHGSSTDKKLHLISWRKTTLPYCFGSLGIPDIKSMYFGFACTFMWRFYSINYPLNSWYKTKFDSPFNLLNTRASHYWKLICSTSATVKHSLNFNVTNTDCSLSLQWDPWVKGKSLAEMNLHCLQRGLLVSNVITNGSWNLSLIPQHMHQLFLSIHIQDGDNVITWTGKGVAVNDGLKTADVLAVRGILINPTCGFCHTEEESSSHLFFQCPFSFSILQTMLPDVKLLLLENLPSDRVFGCPRAMMIWYTSLDGLRLPLVLAPLIDVRSMFRVVIRGQPGSTRAHRHGVEPLVQLVFDFLYQVLFF